MADQIAAHRDGQELNLEQGPAFISSEWNGVSEALAIEQLQFLNRPCFVFKATKMSQILGRIEKKHRWMER